MNRTLLLLGLAAALAGCSGKGFAKSDATVGHVAGPVGISARSHVERHERTYKGFERLKHLFDKVPQTGCVYLTIDAAPKLNHDNGCQTPTEVRRVITYNPADRVSLAEDATGERIAWFDDGTWHVWALLDGEFVGAPVPSTSKGLSPATPIDWSTLPSPEQLLTNAFFSLLPEQQDKVRDRLFGDKPAATMIELLGETDPESTGWSDAFEALPVASRTTVVKKLRDRALSEGSLLDWFDEHPDQWPPNLLTDVRAQARLALSRGETSAVSQWLPWAVRHEDPEAGAIACALLSQLELSRSFVASYEGSDMPEVDQAVWLTLAKTKVHCEEVTETLRPCDTELRCGAPPAPRVGPEFGEDSVDDEPRILTAPLCGARDLAEAFKRWDPPEPEDNPDADPGLEPKVGAAMMGALRAQGPLPKDFVLKNQRRLYKIRGFTEGDGSPCDNDRLPEMLCTLRPNQTEIDVNGCHYSIDDARKQVSARSMLPPDDAGTQGAPR